jgi:hypothetical protein
VQEVPTVYHGANRVISCRLLVFTSLQCIVGASAIAQEHQFFREGLLNCLESAASFEVSVDEDFVNESQSGGWKQRAKYYIAQDRQRNCFRFDRESGGRDAQFIRTPTDTYFRSGRGGAVTRAGPNREVPLTDAKPFDPMGVTVFGPEEFQLRIPFNFFLANSINVSALSSVFHRDGQLGKITWTYKADELRDGNIMFYDREVWVDELNGFVPTKVNWIRRISTPDNKNIETQLEATTVSEWTVVNNVHLPTVVRMNSPLRATRISLTYTWSSVNTEVSGEVFKPTGFNFRKPTPLLNIKGERPFVEFSDIVKRTPPVKVPEPQSSWRAIGILVNCAVVALVIALLAWRQFVAKRNAMQ